MLTQTHTHTEKNPVQSYLMFGKKAYFLGLFFFLSLSLLFAGVANNQNNRENQFGWEQVHFCR